MQVYVVINKAGERIAEFRTDMTDETGEFTLPLHAGEIEPGAHLVEINVRELVAKACAVAEASGKQITFGAGKNCIDGKPFATYEELAQQLQISFDDFLISKE